MLKTLLERHLWQNIDASYIDLTHESPNSKLKLVSPLPYFYL